jgi:hypothetical protein
MGLMKKIALLLILVVFLISSCDEGLPEIEIEKDAKSVYDGSKESVLLLKPCPFIISYPEYTLDSNWAPGWSDYIFVYAFKEGSEPFEMKEVIVPSISSGSGFIVGDKVITNSHLFDCDSEDMLESVQNYMASVTWHIDENREIGKSDYYDQEYEDSLNEFYNYVDIDLDYEASKILDYTKENWEFGDLTNWTKENVKDEIIMTLARHIYDYGEIAAVKEDYALAYSPRDGYGAEYPLTLLEKGEPWPNGEDYAVLHMEDANNFGGVKLGNSDEVEIADSAFIISYPAVVDISPDIFPEPTISQGIISSKKTTSSGIVYIQTDVSARPGSSGGPIFNRYGKVIGILTAGDSSGDFNFLLPINYVADKLEKDYDIDSLTNEIDWDSERATEPVSEDIACWEFIAQNLPDYLTAEEVWDTEMILPIARQLSNQVITGVTWKDGEKIIFEGRNLFVKGKLLKDQNTSYFYDARGADFQHGTDLNQGNYFKIYDIGLARINETNKFEIASYKPGVCRIN